MENNIFIWVSYGMIDVYSIDTYEKLHNLYEDIANTMADFVDEDVITKADNFVDNNPNLKTGCIKSINYLLEQFDIGSHESFEIGTGFGKLK